MGTVNDSWDDLFDGAMRAGDVVDGKYRLERILGKGGQGVVLQAWHLILDQPVALKWLDPSRASAEHFARFEREARAAFKLKSEHVARIYDIATLEDGTPYIVMELLEGEDLKTLIARKGPQPVAEAVEYLLQACEAISEAHAEGIIHRDLKPANLFLTTRRDGTACIKVLDFGVSKLVPLDTTTETFLTLTAADRALGSPHFMAPEQWASSRDVGPSADQWSLGTILYYLLAGEPPFDDTQLPGLCHKVVNEEPTPLSELRPELPEALIAIVTRCLEKYAHRRYPSVAELALALVEFAPRRCRETVRRASKVLRDAGLASEQAVLPTSIPPPPEPSADEPAVADEEAEVVPASSETAEVEPPEPTIKKPPQKALWIGGAIVVAIALGALVWTRSGDGTGTAKFAPNQNSTTTADGSVNPSVTAAPTPTSKPTQQPVATHGSSATASGTAPEPTSSPTVSTKPSARPGQGSAPPPNPTITKDDELLDTFE